MSRMRLGGVPWGERLAALCGVLGVWLVVAPDQFVSSGAANPASLDFVAPEDPARQVVRVISAGADETLAAAYVSIIGTILLIVFLGRFHGALRLGLGARSWWPSVALIGIAAFLAADLDSIMVALASGQSGGYGDDPQAAKTLLLLGYLHAAAFAPGLMAILLAGTVAALTSPALPTWLGWVGGVLLLGAVLLFMFGRIGGATVPSMLWLFIAATVLVFRAPQPQATATLTAAA